MENKILFVDTETGGLDPNETSLLSIGLVVWDNGKITDTKEILIKHDIFKITPQSIQTNMIDLQKFIQQSLPPESALKEFVEFLDNNFKACMGKVVLGGHNTNFDINFLRRFMEANNFNFDAYFTHRFVDTASILKFLFYAGKLPQDVSSSDEAFKFFNINVTNRHSALGDAVATAQLFNKLIGIVNI